MRGAWCGGGGVCTRAGCTTRPAAELASHLVPRKQRSKDQWHTRLGTASPPTRLGRGRRRGPGWGSPIAGVGVRPRRGNNGDRAVGIATDCRRRRKKDDMKGCVTVCDGGLLAASPGGDARGAIRRVTRNSSASSQLRKGRTRRRTGPEPRGWNSTRENGETEACRCDGEWSSDDAAMRPGSRRRSSAPETRADARGAAPRPAANAQTLPPAEPRMLKTARDGHARRARKAAPTDPGAVGGRSRAASGRGERTSGGGRARGRAAAPPPQPRRSCARAAAQRAARSMGNTST
jgi:hypothetical protein